MIIKADAKKITYSENELVIIDPPYNIGYKYNGTFVDKQPIKEYQKLFIPMVGNRVVIIHYIENIINDIVPILGSPTKVVSWHYPSNMGNKSWRAIAWFNCKPNFKKVRVPYKNPNDKRIKELVKRTGGRSLPDNWEINLVKNVSKEKIKEYTNQIPEQVIERIIKTTAEPTDIITDSFCGTGTTLAVAKKLGYKYKGYDCNDLAIEITNKRLQSIS